MIHIFTPHNERIFSKVFNFPKMEYDDYSFIDNRFRIWFKTCRNANPWEYTDMHFRFGVLTKYYYCVRVNYGARDWDKTKFVRFRCYRNNELYNFKTKLLSK